MEFGKGWEALGLYFYALATCTHIPHSQPLPPQAELIFTQPEVECCFKHAVWTAEFAARETQEGRNKSCRPVRLILCIPCAALHRIGQDLEALLGSPAE